MNAFMGAPSAQGGLQPATPIRAQIAQQMMSPVGSGPKMNPRAGVRGLMAPQTPMQPMHRGMAMY